MKQGQATYKRGVNGTFFNAYDNVNECFKVLEDAIAATGANKTLSANGIRVRRGVGIGRYLKRAWELLNGAEGADDTVSSRASQTQSSPL